MLNHVEKHVSSKWENYTYYLYGIASSCGGVFFLTGIYQVHLFRKPCLKDTGDCVVFCLNNLLNEGTCSNPRL
jgi:hypothetical protein